MLLLPLTFSKPFPLLWVPHLAIQPTISCHNLGSPCRQCDYGLHNRNRLDSSLDMQRACEYIMWFLLVTCSAKYWSQQNNEHQKHTKSQPIATTVVMSFCGRWLCVFVWVCVCVCVCVFVWVCGWELNHIVYVSFQNANETFGQSQLVCVSHRDCTHAAHVCKRMSVIYECFHLYWTAQLQPVDHLLSNNTPYQQQLVLKNRHTLTSFHQVLYCY